jgi:predicted transcriptional regulator
MSTQITITLTDDVYQKADRFARLANRDIASILADIIQSSIPNIRGCLKRGIVGIKSC